MGKTNIINTIINESQTVNETVNRDNAELNKALLDTIRTWDEERIDKFMTPLRIQCTVTVGTQDDQFGRVALTGSNGFRIVFSKRLGWGLDIAWNHQTHMRLYNSEKDMTVIRKIDFINLLTNADITQRLTSAPNVGRKLGGDTRLDKDDILNTYTDEHERYRRHLRTHSMKVMTADIRRDMEKRSGLRFNPKGTPRIIKATETVNVENAELNAKILAALLSPSAYRIKNKDTLAQLGIKYGGTKDIVLIGPNGRRITRYRYANNEVSISGLGKSSRWSGGRVRNPALFDKIDFVTLLTHPDKAEHGQGTATWMTGLDNGQADSQRTNVYKDDILAKYAGERSNYRHYQYTQVIGSDAAKRVKVQEIIQAAQQRGGFKVNPNGKPRITKAK
jgi:hypothetical protein